MGEVFYLNPKTIKSQCNSEIKKCVEWSKDYPYIIKSLAEFVNFKEISCSGIDALKAAALDCDNYFKIIDASIAAYQNGFIKLSSSVGEDILDSKQIYAEIERLKQTATVMERVENQVLNNCSDIVYENVINKNPELKGHIQKVQAECNDSIRVLNQKIEKYYEIEKNTTHLFDSGDNYRNTARNILGSINKSYNSINYYSVDSNASWRNEIADEKYQSDLVVLQDNRARNYLKYRGLSDEQVNDLLVLGFDTSVAYNYVALTKNKKNEEIILNIMKGNKECFTKAFKGDPDEYDEMAASFAGRYQTALWNKIYDEKHNIINDKDPYYNKFLDFENAVNNPDKDVKGKELPKNYNNGSIPYGGQIRNKMVTPKDYYAPRYIEKYRKMFTASALYDAKSYAKLASDIAGSFKNINDADTKSQKAFRTFQNQYAQSLALVEYNTALIEQCKGAIKDNFAYFGRHDIAKIDEVSVGGTGVMPSVTIKTHDTRGKKCCLKSSFNVKEGDKEKVESINKIISKQLGGPHELKEQLIKMGETFTIAGMTVINPTLGAATATIFEQIHTEIDAAKEEGNTSGDIEEEGGLAKKVKDAKDCYDKYIEKNKFYNTLKDKSVDKVKELYQQHLKEQADKIYNSIEEKYLKLSESSRKSLGKFGKGVKAGTLAIASMDNLIDIMNAYEEDENFAKEIAKEKSDFMEAKEESYICSKCDENNTRETAKVTGVNLSNEILKKRILNGKVELYVCDSVVDDGRKALKEKMKNHPKSIEFGFKDKKESYSYKIVDRADDILFLQQSYYLDDYYRKKISDIKLSETERKEFVEKQKFLNQKKERTAKRITSMSKDELFDAYRVIDLTLGYEDSSNQITSIEDAEQDSILRNEVNKEKK